MTYCVNGINSFSTFVPFALDPVTIEKGEHSVDVFRSSCVSIPFTSIVSQEGLVLESVRLL